MITTISLALAFGAGVDWRPLALLAMAVHLPAVTAGLIAVVVLSTRRAHELDGAVFCEAVAAELRSGASLRSALALAVDHDEGVVPDGIEDLARDVSRRFPEVGPELESAIVNGARSGSRVAAVFDEIGGLAIAKAEVRREVRMAAAAGRMTALVLVAAPTVFLATQISTGGIGDLLMTSQQRVAGLLGLGLFAVGAGIAGLVTYRATR